MLRSCLCIFAHLAFAAQARHIRLPTVNCTESSPIGTPISRFDDVLPTANWEFTFLTQTSIRSYFLLDQLKGTLTIQRLLDREHLCRLNLCSCSSECTIKLEFNAISDTSAHLLSLPIRLADENDNYCAFAHERFALNLTEQVRVDTRVSLPLAYDPDLSPNNVQSYHFLDNNHSQFRLDQQLTPSLIVVRQLDRELCERYEFTFCADEGVGVQKRSCCTKITVTLTDVNDNAPKFEHPAQSPLIVDVSELTSVETELVRVRATDPDEGLNGEVRYSLSRWTLMDETIQEMFSVQPENGSIVLRKPLDYEKRTKYELQIEAKDRGANAVSSFATVIVQVVDENDCAPEVFLFSPTDILFVNNSRLYAAENISKSSPILYLTVSDRDSGENGQFSLELLPSNSFVSLQRITDSTFMIRTTSLFDREEHPSYAFTVLIYDHGQPSNSILNTFTLHLLDVNDCAPYFDPSSNYTFLVDENNRENFVLHTIRTFDADENDSIALHLNFSNDKDRPLFSLNDANQLLIRKSLDYEVQSSYEFTLIAEDSIGHRTSIPIRVQLNDLNDNPVKFPTNSTRLILSDRSPRGTLLTTIRAEDRDRNARIAYRIHPSSMLDFVELLPNGHLVTTRPFTRKEIPQFHLSILANDSLHTDTLHIEVFIHHQPVLLTPSPYCYPFHHSQQPILVQLEASSNVSFSLRSPSSDLILFPNGTLVATARLDRYSFDIDLQDEHFSSVFPNFHLVIESDCHLPRLTPSHLTAIISGSLCLFLSLLLCSCCPRRKLPIDKTQPSPPSFSSSLDETFFFSAASPQFTAMTIVSSTSSSQQQQQQTSQSSSLSSSGSSTYIKMSQSFDDELI